MTFVATPFPMAGVTAADTADVAVHRVTAFVGANGQARNPIDRRAYDSVASGTGRIINDLNCGIQAAERAAVPEPAGPFLTAACVGGGGWLLRRRIGG